MGMEGPEPGLCWPLSIPLVVAGEVDVFPPEWREVFEKLRVDGLALAGEGLNSSLDRDLVPEGDCRCDEGQSAGPVAKLRSLISPRRQRKTALASALRASPLLSPA